MMSDHELINCNLLVLSKIRRATLAPGVRSRYTLHGITVRIASHAEVLRASSRIPALLRRIV